MIKDLASKIYSWLRPAIAYGNGNEIVMPAKHSGVKVRIYGNNNKVIIAKNCFARDTTINVHGDNNTLIVGDAARLIGPIFITVRNGGGLYIGAKCAIRGVTFEISEASMKLGERCMFSYGIIMRNHDSHKVLSKETGDVINKPMDVVLGDHVWVCENATIMKGVTIGNDSIVALGALVTKNVPSNCVAAGIPAKITKTDITWDY